MGESLKNKKQINMNNFPIFSIPSAWQGVWIGLGISGSPVELVETLGRCIRQVGQESVGDEYFLSSLFS
jgi:hypothetical protein